MTMTYPLPKSSSTYYVVHNQLGSRSLEFDDAESNAMTSSIAEPCKTAGRNECRSLTHRATCHDKSGRVACWKAAEADFIWNNRPNRSCLSQL